MLCFKFGLQSVKMLAMIGTFFVTVIGITIILFSIPYYNKLITLREVIGARLEYPSQACLGFGVALVFLTVLGYLAIYLNGYGMMVVYNFLLCLAFIIAIIFGILFLGEARSDESKYMMRLKHILPDLEPYELDQIQKDFHCCGIEYYKDYYRLWTQWNMSSTVREFTKPESHTPRLTISSTMTLQSRLTPFGRAGGKSKVRWQKLPVKISVEGDLELLPEAPETQQRKVWQTYNLSKKEDDEPMLPPKKLEPKTKSPPIEEPDIIFADEEPSEYGEPSWKFITNLKRTVSNYIMKMVKYILSVLWKNKNWDWENRFKIMIRDFMEPYYEYIKEVWYLQKQPWKATRRWYYSDWSDSSWYYIEKERVKEREMRMEQNADFKKFNVKQERQGDGGGDGGGDDGKDDDKDEDKEEETTTTTTTTTTPKPLNKQLIHLYHKKMSNLPYSCCKNPSRLCNGLYSQTYQIGCKHRIIQYFRMTTLELGSMCLIFALVILQSIMINLLFIAGIREKYYF